MKRKFDLKADIAAKSDELKALLQKAEDEGRKVFTKEEGEKFDSLTSEVKELKAQLARQEEADALATEFAKTQNTTENLARNGGVIESVKRADGNHPFRSLGEQLLAVARFSRTGRMDERLNVVQMAASGASEGSGPDGGFLVQENFIPQILKRSLEITRIAPRVNWVEVGPNANGIAYPAVDDYDMSGGAVYGGVIAYWVAEATAPTATKPKVRIIRMHLGKVAGLFYSTDELEQDASAVNSIAMQAFPEAMALAVDNGIWEGTGTNGEPYGITKAPALIVQAKETGQVAATVVLKNFTNMKRRLLGRNGVWFVSPTVESELIYLNRPVGTGGDLVYQLINGDAGQTGRLLGLPVVVVEQAEAIGTQGDVVLADMSQYLGIRKGMMESATSMHVNFTTFENAFRISYRCNGQPIPEQAFKPLKNATDTRSPFVALAVRS